MLDRRQSRQHELDGISLYTMLAAVVVLGVITSIAVTRFNTSQSKAQAVISLAQSTGLAAKRFHADTGCWPTNVVALLRFDEAQRNTCGRAIASTRWEGPYIEQREIVPRRAPSDTGYPTLLVNEIGPETRLIVWVDNGQPTVHFSYLPNSVRSKLDAMASATGDTYKTSTWGFGEPYLSFRQRYSRYVGEMKCCDGRSYDQ